MFGTNPNQKVNPNTSQYDFKGVAVCYFLYSFRLDLHLVRTRLRHQELEEVLQQEDQFPIEA